MEIHKVFGVPNNYLWKFGPEVKQKKIKQMKNQNNFKKSIVFPWMFGWLSLDKPVVYLWA